MQRMIRRLLLTLFLALPSISFAVGCTGTGVCFWVLGTGNTNDVSHWATTDGGVTVGGVPSATDDCRFTAASNTTAYVVTVNASLACKDLSFLAAPSVSGTVTFAGSSAVSIAGNETLLSGMSSTYSGTKTFTATATGKTLTSNGVSRAGNVVFDGVGGGWTLADAYTSTGTFTLTNGAFDSNGMNVTLASLASSNSNTRSLALSTGTWSITGTGTIWSTATATNLTLTQSAAGIVQFTNASASARTVTSGTITSVSMSGTWKVTAGSGDFTGFPNLSGIALDWTGFTGNWLTGGLSGKSLTMASGMTVATAASGVNFTATGAITSNGVQIKRPITVTTGATTTLADALATDQAFTVTAGTFSDAGFSLTAASFSSSNSNVRTITKTGNWTLTGPGTVANIATVTNLTWTDSGSTSLTDASASALTFTCGVITFGNLNVTASSGTLTFSSGTTTFNNLNFTGYTGQLQVGVGVIVQGNLTFGSGMTAAASGAAITVGGSTGSKTITSNGVTANRGLTINSSGSATTTLVDALNLGTGTLTVTQGTFIDAGFTVTATAFASATASTRAITKTGNWTLTGTGSVFSNASSTGITFTDSGSTTLNNATATARTVAFNGLSLGDFLVTAGTGDITLPSSASFVKSWNFTGFTGNWLASGIGISSGNFTAGTGMTATDGSGTLLMTGTSGTQTITSNGVAINKALTINSPGATTILADDYVSATRLMTLTAGTFNANNKNLTLNAITSSNSNVRALTMGSGLWTFTGAGSGIPWQFNTVTNLTLNAGTSTIKITDTSATRKDFNGGGMTYNNLWFSGAGTGDCNIGSSSTGAGDTFNDIKIDAAPKNIGFANTTTFSTLTGFTGTAGNLIVLKSRTAPGTSYTLKKLGAIVSTDYMSVSDMIGNPGYSWFMGGNSTNGGNNFGVAFSTPANAAAGSMFQ